MELRAQNIQSLDGGSFDVLIVGGGINGAVSAAALAARGVKVAIVDRSDFASFTSQESSNLVWGGFKYLENYELGLVWKLCGSRNQLMKAYPNAISEISFLATLDQTAPFPAPLAGLGTLGYWGFGRFATKPPKYLRPKAIKAAEPVVNTSTAKGGIQYQDAYLKDNDARFVWSFVRSALDNGATAANYVSLLKANRQGEQWHATLRDEETGRDLSLVAKTIVNAAGPFVDGLNESWDNETEHRIVYSKGIHLIVPRLNDSERVLAFFDDTGRLFYVIPMAHRSVIGTTDTRTEDPSEGVLDEDRDFLISQINARLDLDTPLTKADIVSERVGVRPLVVKNGGGDQTDVDWTSLSRKHEIDVDMPKKIVTIFGGKLTDCLNVGEEVIEAVASLGVPIGPEVEGWYGEPSEEEHRRFAERAQLLGLGRAPTIERESTIADVLWRRHGAAAYSVLDAIDEDPSLAEPVLGSSDLLRGELPLMAEREMITRPDDFLRRRTKLSLVLHRDELGADPGMDEVNRVLFSSS